MTPPRESALALVPDQSDFIGRGTPGRFHRIFGGATLGQTIRAAQFTLECARAVDSIHAIFVAPGDARREVRYRVAPVKRGRSLDVMSVHATQGERVILTAHVTFHDGDASPEFQSAAPAAPPPSELTTRAEGLRNVLAPFDVRPVPRDDREPRREAWIRLRTPPAEGADAAAAHLAYAVDFLITRPAHIPLDDRVISAYGASLDHAMWFHRTFDITRWLLVSSWATSFTSSRSLCHTQVFDEDGLLVASATQEALLPPTPAGGR